MVGLARMHAGLILYIDLAPDTVNVDEDGEDIEYLPDDGRPGMLVSDSHGAHAVCYLDHHTCACLNHKCGNVFQCYSAGNAYLIGSSLDYFRKVCVQCCYS